MKIILKFLVLFQIAILISCNKDSSENQKNMAIGIPDSKIINHDIVPDTIITSWETKSNYPIDINNDNEDDINFSVLNQYMFGGMSLWNSELRVETLNPMTFVELDSIYPKVLSSGDYITINDKWENGNLLLLHSSEGCCPPNGKDYHEGPWLGKNENYIGIRYGEKLGWIKIGVLNYTSIKVYEYAIMK